jgi:hypothetical protein
VSEPTGSARDLLAELDRLHAALPRVRFGDRCFSCEASCCLRVNSGEYAVLLLPGEMYRLVQAYPTLCGTGRFRRFHGIEVLVGCGASAATSVCPIGGAGFDCRVFPMYVAADAGGRPVVWVDERCPLRAEVPPETVQTLQAVVDRHPTLFGPYAHALRRHYATISRGDSPYAEAEPIADERAYLRAQGFVG